MPEKPTCSKCERPCTEDHFCHGCRSYVCDDCELETDWSVADAIVGTHSLEDHFVEADECT